MARSTSSSSAPPWSAHIRKRRDRKSTRLNSSHRCISYAVFCLKKKKKKKTNRYIYKKRKTHEADRIYMTEHVDARHKTLQLDEEESIISDENGSSRSTYRVSNS